MKVLLLRHAQADDRDEFAQSGRPDEERPLTRDGRAGMRRIATAIAKLVPELDIIATSPLTRALQTATILAGAYPDMEIVKVNALSPGVNPDEALKWLRARANLRGVALVGHEPDLHILLSHALTATPLPIYEFKKGGAALLEFAGKAEPGRARLEWAMKPSVLRALSGARL